MGFLLRHVSTSKDRVGPSCLGIGVWRQPFRMGPTSLSFASLLSDLLPAFGISTLYHEALHFPGSEQVGAIGDPGRRLQGERKEEAQ